MGGPASVCGGRMHRPNGVEPPEGHFIWKIWGAWDKVAASPDPADQNKHFQELLDIWAEELPMIGVVGEMPAPIIVKNGFHNYLPGQPTSMIRLAMSTCCGRSPTSGTIQTRTRPRARACRLSGAALAPPPLAACGISDKGQEIRGKEQGGDERPRLCLELLFATPLSPIPSHLYEGRRTRMLKYILKRIAIMIPTLIMISMISFAIIQLPPGDYLTSYVAGLRQMGDNVDETEIEALRQRYGLGQPVYVQYYKWVSGIILRGDWGQSMEWRKPVKDLIWERMALTVALSLVSVLVSWFVAIPVGVFSATHQYSLPDYVFSALSFIGAGLPGFMIALVVMWVAMRQLGLNVGGLFSQEYLVAPWSWPKFVDLLKHLWIPVLIVALGSTAGSIRTTRANVLDELNKPYVETARAKGLKERKLVLEVSGARGDEPFFSTVGWTLANLISGQTLVAYVLSLRTTGPCCCVP